MPAMSDRPERRLAAILAADVAGYTRLMAEDEARTLAALRALRREQFEPLVDEHRGEVLKRMGDGWLVVFSSVVDAAACAMAVQQVLADDDTIKLRLGVHMGDIVHEDEDIYGDGVNIAARLQESATPGGVLISGTAYDSIVGRLDHQFTDAGEQYFKNVDRPIRVWRWSPDAVSAPSPDSSSPLVADPGRPAIAVMPFENRSGDSEQEYFADGITEDVIAALSKFRWLMVVARNSTFSFKGQNADIQAIGQALGVRYVLEGSVRRAGERVRITGRLVDAIDGTHIWADKFDGVLDDIFDLQDKVSLEVVCAIEPSLRQAETDRVRRKPTDDLEAYEMHLRGQSHFYMLTDEDNREAIRLLSKAIDLDPGYASAAGLLAWCHVQRGVQNWEPLEHGRQQAIELASQTLENDRADALALAFAGHAVTMLLGDMARARPAFEKSLAENPNSALAHSLYAAFLLNVDEPDRALDHADQALRLSPRDTFLYTFQLTRSMALFQIGHYSDAVESARASIAHRGSFLLSRCTLVAALALSDERPAAHREAQQLLSMAPTLSVSSLKASAPFFFRTSVADKFHHAWIEAGIPE
jgi:TolB-like protein